MPDVIIVELFLEKSLPDCGSQYDKGMPIDEPTKLNLPRTIFFVVVSLGIGTVSYTHLTLPTILLV